jgi:hypothetical protein
MKMNQFKNLLTPLSWYERPAPITHDEKCMKSMSETKNYVWLQKYCIPHWKGNKIYLIKDIMRKRHLGL